MAPVIIPRIFVGISAANSAFTIRLPVYTQTVSRKPANCAA
jgi:hypothetical protein